MDINTIKACIFGHAVADALGVPVEFLTREELRRKPVTDMQGFGTYNVPAGSWSDDTSMTLCALESLTSGKLDLDDIMKNFGKWYYNNEFNPTGITFDVGNTCSCAIDRYFGCGCDAKTCGLADENSNGNGSLMRIIPFVLFAIAKGDSENYDEFLKTISEASALTHAHQRSKIACEIYATVLKFLIENPSKNSVENGIDFYRKQNENHSTELEYFKKIDKNILGKLSVDEIKSTGYVVDTLEAALWCLLKTDSYKECVLKAVNLGSDTDTVAAVAGGLAGALYGYDAIPKEWLEKLQRREYIEDMCQRAVQAWE